MRTTTVVVGGGQSGLAMSQCLSVRSIDHVVIERSEVANSWRRERWDSLRLLTPNWQCRLPGLDYRGDDPDGFMSALEVADFIAEYAKVIAAPVIDGTTVSSVRRTDDGYLVTTEQGEWNCPTVVVATGAFNLPQRARLRHGRAIGHRDVNTYGVPQPRPAPPGWRDGGRGVCNRRANRFGDPTVRP